MEVSPPGLVLMQVVSQAHRLCLCLLSFCGFIQLMMTVSPPSMSLETVSHIQANLHAPMFSACLCKAMFTSAHAEISGLWSWLCGVCVSVVVFTQCSG